MQLPQSLDPPLYLLLHLNHLLLPLHIIHQSHILFLLNSLPLQLKSLYLLLLVSTLSLSLLPALIHHLQPCGNTENPLQLSPQMMMMATVLLRLPQRKTGMRMRMMMMMEMRKMPLTHMNIYWMECGKVLYSTTKKGNMPEMERCHNQDIVTIKGNIDGSCNQII